MNNLSKHSQYDRTWDNLTTLLASGMASKDAWKMFMNFLEQTIQQSLWTKLLQLDIESEQTEIVEWLQQLVTASPIPKTIVAIWIGIFLAAEDDEEIPTIYIAGADTYDKDDPDWACDPAYMPENGYAQLGVLREIYDIARADKANYMFLTWILPIAYCAFTFDEIIRTKLDGKLFLISKDVIFVAVGHDGGDYVDLTPIR